MFSYLTNNEERGLFEEFNRLQREMDQRFGSWQQNGIRSGRAGAFPPLNIAATAEEVHVMLFAPGLSPDDFDVSIQQNVLSVAGTRKLAEPKDGTGYLRERFAGEFRRVVTLPEDVDPDLVQASYRDGVLRLCIKRRSTVRTRQITIN